MTLDSIRIERAHPPAVRNSKTKEIGLPKCLKTASEVCPSSIVRYQPADALLTQDGVDENLLNIPGNFSYLFQMLILTGQAASRGIVDTRTASRRFKFDIAYVHHFPNMMCAGVCLAIWNPIVTYSKTPGMSCKNLSL